MKRSACHLSHSRSGFNLSELLIVLTVLGLLATFAIPKVLQTVGENQKKAVGKNSIIALHEALYAGWLAGDITEASTYTQVGDYLAAKLNVVRDCKPGRAVDDCVTSFPAPNHFSNTKRIFVLHNGAWISMQNVDALGWENIHFFVDYNGTAGPNVDTHHSPGTVTEADITALWFNPTQQQITASPTVHGPAFKPGTLVPDYAFGDREQVYKYWMGLP